VPEVIVLDASAMVEALIGTPVGSRVRARTRGCELHAGDLEAETVTIALNELAAAPIARHQLTGLLLGAWGAREQLRLVDALYAELSTALPAVLVTTDARLARAFGSAELVSTPTS
jgi:predicted nucleic acid-binding protein